MFLRGGEVEVWSGFAVSAARLALPDAGLVSYAEMHSFCARIPGPKMANMLEGGATPVLPPDRLQEIGYRIAAYPLTLLNSALYAMREALGELAAGRAPQRCVDFATIRGIVGFDEYDRTLRRYSGEA